MDKEILNKFFEPKNIALIGATRTPGFGFGIPTFWKKQGWLERAFLVNPKGGEIEGRKVFSAISELPNEIDLAVVIVPANAVKGVLIELGKKGTQAVVIESAGFAELGEEGKEKQEELLKVAQEYGIRLLGPNCVGVVNTENRFATIELIDQALEPGKVGIIAQSGVFGNILLDHLPEVGIKVSKVATLGNKIDLDESDFLEYLSEDEKTQLIMIYQEGVKDGERFIKVLRETTRKKPVVILKSGRTPFGQKATLSHTGSLSGEDDIYDAVFQQAGAIRAQNLTEMIELVKVISTQPVMKGKKIGVLTTSGSIGAMTADAIYKQGLELAQWSEPTIEKIKKVAPGYLNIKNPLDVGPSGIFNSALSAIISDSMVDGYILIPVVPFGAIERFRAFGVNAKNYLGDWQELRRQIPEKPIVVMLLGYKDWIKDIQELCGDNIATVSLPENAVKALSALYSFNQAKKDKGFY